MSVYGRAYLYVTRKKGKTILLLLILFILMTLLLTGTAMNRTAEKASAELREELGGYFKIVPDYQKMTISQRVDQALADRIMEIKGIKACNTMDTYYLMTEDLSLEPGRFAMEGDAKAQMARFLGNTSSGLHEYFELGIFTLAEGRHLEPSDEGKALISQTMSETNGLEIGDTITARTVGEEAGDKIFSFEIAGIFDEGYQESAGAYTAECDLPSNFIFIDSTSSQAVKEQLNGTEDGSFQGGAAFFAKDPRDLERIVADVRKIDGIDWESLKLTVNNSAYESRMEPLKRLEGMTLLLVGLIGAIGAVLLSLLLILWERDRIHEAGVLMSFGISKRNIFWQHFLECGTVYLLAFCLAAAVSFPVSGQIGRVVYDNAASGEEEEEIQQFGAVTDPVSLDRLEESAAFEVRLEPGAAVISGVLGLALVSVCTGIAFCVIARRRPRELLTMME